MGSNPAKPSRLPNSRGAAFPWSDLTSGFVSGLRFLTLEQCRGSRLGFMEQPSRTSALAEDFAVSRRELASAANPPARRGPSLARAGAMPIQATQPACPAARADTGIRPLQCAG